MSNQFAMLNATRKLEVYLSREFYNLDRMRDNDKVPDSLLETKANHYNDLVDTLNNLFGALIGSTEGLFERYELDYVTDDGESTVYYDTPEIAAVENESEAVPLGVTDSNEDIPERQGILVAEAVYQEQDIVQEESEQDEVVEEGPESVQEEPVSEEDMVLGVNILESQERAGQALVEYAENAEQDIVTYNPEDDIPVSVLPESVTSRGERPTENLAYLNHTVDNIRVDADPTQIAGVETAIEREGEEARQGNDIGVEQFMNQPTSTFGLNVLDDEIAKLQVTKEPVEELEESDEEEVNGVSDGTDEPQDESDNPDDHDDDEDDFPPMTNTETRESLDVDSEDEESSSEYL